MSTQYEFNVRGKTLEEGAMYGVAIGAFWTFRNYALAMEGSLIRTPLAVFETSNQKTVGLTEGQATVMIKDKLTSPSQPKCTENGLTKVLRLDALLDSSKNEGSPLRFWHFE